MMSWIAEWHVMIVHFPIGLLTTATALDGYGWWRGRARAGTASLLVLGTIGAWLACLTGLLIRQQRVSRGIWVGTDMAVVLNVHLALSLAAAALFSVSAILRLRGRMPLALEAGGALVLLVSAHLGGVLAHGGM